jgi:hypothetical protein
LERLKRPWKEEDGEAAANEEKTNDFFWLAMRRDSGLGRNIPSNSTHQYLMLCITVLLLFGLFFKRPMVFARRPMRKNTVQNVKQTNGVMIAKAP